MGKFLTTSEFIERARKVHGDKYDYSKAQYVNSQTKVCIVCPIHGEFWQTPKNHLQKHGCPMCKAEQQKTLLFGWGKNDLFMESNTKAHRTWQSMLSRCYSESYRRKFTSYIGCTVCNEWLTFSNFKKWFEEHYVDGWELDKDILVKGNKVYSPETCCFVPQEINRLLTKAKKRRGKYPIGVSKHYNSFVAYCQQGLGQRRERLGKFSTPEEAFVSYKKAKENIIKSIAEKYKGRIEEKVYNSLMDYKVEITD